ncbi:hypothetical protein [Microbulbifer sp. M83]|uniref:hypothetical protein n=1 Tax=Microbulbifer sp. M83 TaxID=3118246 RepID=UPI002FE39461
MDIETVSQLLEGYLLALRRLSGNRCDFWSLTTPLKDDVEKSLKAHFSGIGADTTIIGKTAIGYAELETLLDHHVFSRLEAGEKTHCELFGWDIVEFIQMSYRELEPEIDPLHTREAMSFDVSSRSHGAHVYIVVPVKEKALVIGLGARA